MFRRRRREKNQKLWDIVISSKQTPISAKFLTDHAICRKLSINHNDDDDDDDDALLSLLLLSPLLLLI